MSTLVDGLPGFAEMCRHPRVPVRTPVALPWPWVPPLTATSPDGTARNCSACGHWKEMNEFHRNRGDRIAGRQYVCKECMKGR